MSENTYCKSCNKGSRATLTDYKDWRQVRSEGNPADLVFRGATEEEIIRSNLLISGPFFGYPESCNWPKTSITPIAVIPERRRSTVSNASGQPNEEVTDTDYVVKKFSKIEKLIRCVTAYCMRFMRNCKTKD